MLRVNANGPRCELRPLGCTLASTERRTPLRSLLQASRRSPGHRAATATYKFSAKDTLNNVGFSAAGNPASAYIGPPCRSLIKSRRPDQGRTWLAQVADMVDGPPSPFIYYCGTVYRDSSIVGLAPQYGAEPWPVWRADTGYVCFPSCVGPENAHIRGLQASLLDSSASYM